MAKEAVFTPSDPKSKYADEKGRLYFYDNAKFLLIFLVVLAHAISPFQPGYFGIIILWKAINTFHMPLMIFISGFFAKRYLSSNGDIKVQRSFSYFMLYLFSQLFVSLFEKFVLKNESVGFSIISARSSLWFLMCLGIWYLVLPFFSKFKGAAVIIAGIIIGLIIGYDTHVGHELSLSRVFVHFPFFMAGYFCTPELIAKLNNKYIRFISFPLFAICVSVIVLANKIYPGRIITCSNSYENVMAVVNMQYGLVWLSRLLFYALAFVSGAAFLAIVPRRKVFFTKWGSRTLAVYILHRFLYLCWIDKNLAWWKVFDEMKYGLPIVFGIALAVTLILSLKPFSYPFTWIQKIPVKPLLKNKEEKAK
ncbi:MAG: acyltransferase family protein [Clostridia bacterium]|nr:acyltransferase family protein [Clostridia bacterium]